MNTIDRTSILIESFGWTAAVDAARRLGILERLRAAPATAAELAEELHLDARDVAILMQALRFVGAVVMNGDARYRPEPQVSRIAEHWRELEARLRQGVPAKPFDTPEGASMAYDEVVEDLGDRQREAATRAAAQLAAPDLDVLDLAAGAVPWSLAILDREPSCRITAVELPRVARATARAIEASPHGDAFRLREGDVFAVELGDAAYDLAIIAGVCHLFGADQNRALLRRARRALRPGGRLAIIDVVPEDESNERVLHLYRLSLLLRTQAGQVYPFASFASWMSEAGLVDIDRVPLSGTPRMSLLRARRPH